MQTIALVSQKGGVGKTVLASNLAIAAAEAGRRTIVLDLDDQRSIVQWAGRRKERHARLDVAQLDDVAQLPAIRVELAKKYDVLILDCPGRFDTGNRIAMENVDLALIPARPAILDIQAAQTTVRALVALRRRFAFVLNQCPVQPNNPRAKNAAMGLQMLGVLAEPFVVQRADYQDAIAYGQGVVEWDGASKAAAEIRQLWEWCAAQAAETTGAIEHV